MKYSFLERPLIYEDKKDIDDILCGDPFRTALYRLFIRIKDNSFFGERLWAASTLDTLNEVFYQCTRIVNDPHPESDVKNQYLNETKQHLRSEFAPELIYGMVKVILSLQSEKTGNVQFFLDAIEEYIIHTPYYNSLEQFREEYETKNGMIDTDFSYQPTAPSKLHYDNEWWCEVTEHFDEKKIIEIICRYSETEHQRSLVRKVENAYKGIFPFDTNEDVFFKKLKEDIRANKFITKESSIYPSLSSEIDAKIEKIKETYETTINEQSQLIEEYKNVNNELKEDLHEVKQHLDTVKERLATVNEQNNKLHEEIEWFKNGACIPIAEFTKLVVKDKRDECVRFGKSILEDLFPATETPRPPEVAEALRVIKKRLDSPDMSTQVLLELANKIGEIDTGKVEVAGDYVAGNKNIGHQANGVAAGATGIRVDDHKPTPKR